MKLHSNAYKYVNHNYVQNLDNNLNYEEDCECDSACNTANIATGVSSFSDLSYDQDYDEPTYATSDIDECGEDIDAAFGFGKKPSSTALPVETESLTYNDRNYDVEVTKYAFKNTVDRIRIFIVCDENSEYYGVYDSFNISNGSSVMYIKDQQGNTVLKEEFDVFESVNTDDPGLEVYIDIIVDTSVEDMSNLLDQNFGSVAASTNTDNKQSIMAANDDPFRIPDDDMEEDTNTDNTSNSEEEDEEPAEEEPDIDVVDIDTNNNIENHYIAECSKCHGVFISPVVKSDQAIDEISGICPLCHNTTSQKLKWIIVSNDDIDDMYNSDR